MCQMSVVVEKNGQQEKILENASLLEVTEEGVRVSTLFEVPHMIPGAVIKKIDFLDGVVILTTPSW